MKRVHLRYLARQSIASDITEELGRSTIGANVPRLLTSNHFLTLLHAVRRCSSDWVIRLGQGASGVSTEEIYRLAREALRLHSPGTARNWKAFFTQADKRLLMNEQEHLLLASLPSKIEVFQPNCGRGCSCSLRWTNSREVAILEAQQSALYCRSPRVLFGTCKKEDILGLFLFTEVPELIIPPRRVRIVDVQPITIGDAEHSGEAEEDPGVAEEPLDFDEDRR